MNIFAKIIITTHENIKNTIIKRLNLNFKENTNNLEIFTKQTTDENIVLIYSQNKNFENIINYSKDNYEILKVLNLGTSDSLLDLDLVPGDVIIPNTIINENNEAIFFDYIIDKNYDLKKFGLVLNGICFTKQTEFKNEDEILDLQEEYIAEILDNEAFLLSKELEKNDLIQKSVIIKIVGKSDEFTENGVDILELII